MLSKDSVMRKLVLVVLFICFGIAGTAHADLYTYEYRLRTYADANPVKNLLIQLSDGTTVGNISTSSVAGGTVTNSTGTFTSADLFRLPASIYGINFVVPYGTNQDFSVKFDSPNAPVWGDFFASSHCFDKCGDNPGIEPGFANLGFAYNNRALSFYIPRPDGGGATSVPEANWVGLLTNIDNNSADLSPPGTRVNSDSGLYAAGDRWYYQANDSIGGGTGTGGTYHDDGWVEFSWKITSDPVSVPEPSTMLLLGFGLVGMGVAEWRKFRK